MKDLKLKDFGLSRTRVVLFLALASSASIAELMGMAALLPVLEYMENGQDISILAEQSRHWAWIIDGFRFLGLDVSLISLLAVFLVLICARVLLMYSRQIYTVWLTQDVLHTIRDNLFKAYLSARYSFFDKVSTGQVVNVVTTETTRTGGYISASLNIFSNSLNIVALLVVLVGISIPNTFLALGLILFSGLVVSYYVRHTRRYSRETTASNEALSFLMVERLTSLRLMKLNAAVARESERLRKASGNVRDNMFFLAKLNSRIELILDPMVALSAAIILYAGSRFGMSMSELILFMGVLLRLMPYSKEVLRNRQNMLSNSASFQKVCWGFTEVRDHAEDLHESGRGFSGVRQGIEYKDVSFTYPEGEDKALDDIRLSIPAGKVTALVGPSGSGKSTLADLLPALRRPQQGGILLDGAPLADFDLLSLRRGIAFVSQDAAILNDTVFNNIAFARDGATEADVQAALEKAKAVGFVQSLPEGLNTVLGERGLRLSGGQRQRLSLARAFVKQAPIMVLDEPTSALDSEVERDIQKVIDEMRAGGEITVVIIAHRLSTIRSADKIVVLSKGRVVEEGSHEELLKDNSWYARMIRMQGEDAGNGKLFEEA